MITKPMGTEADIFWKMVGLISKICTHMGLPLAKTPKLHTTEILACFQWMAMCILPVAVTVSYLTDLMQSDQNVLFFVHMLM
jgi:hypothetical protein